jgi:hypothetical protein
MDAADLIHGFDGAQGQAHLFTTFSFLHSERIGLFLLAFARASESLTLWG